ncbi:MAG: alkene reductase [Devosia sp.]
MSEDGLLFSPVRVGDWDLPSRIVMAPMTRARSGPEGVPLPLSATYYAQRASAGLMVAEATQISADGQGYLRTPGIHTPAQIAGWRAVTQSVHRAGGRIVLQLWHVGRVSHADNREPGSRCVGPSPLAADVKIFTPNGMLPAPVPHALDTAEIAAVIRDYTHAAKNAMEAGFDGVEIHAGNGYLIDQFLQGSANRRTDEYGGEATNRCRFLWEVCEAVMAAVGPGRTGVRLSPFGVFNDVSDDDPARLFAIAIAGLERLKPAYLHVINPEVSGDRTVKATKVDAARFSRRHFSGKLLVAGGYTRDLAEAAIQDGVADLIGFGRSYIANPDLVDRLRQGTALAAAVRATFYTEGNPGYTDYPAAA